MNTFIVILVYLLIFNGVEGIRIGTIHNVSLITQNVWTDLVSGSCEECLCRMVNSNQAIDSFNCYKTNRACRLFSYNSQFARSQLKDELNATFYFLHLPPDNYTRLFWSFDGTINDTENLVNTTSEGGISFISPGIYGRGSAILFNGSQRLVVASSYLDTTADGFTFEMWFYITWLSSTVNTQQDLVGQCRYYNKSNCLHLTIRDNNTYLGFYSDDCRGKKTLSINIWYHVAFVYDAIEARQLIFINGRLDNSCNQRILNSMESVPLTIGSAHRFSYKGKEHVCIDQVFYINRPKSADEVLNDATLVAYFNFNSNLSFDSTLNRIIATPYNVTLINNTLLFNDTFSSFQIERLAFPNIYDISFSIALWICPSSINSSTLINVSNNSSCWDMMSFDDQGQLILQTPDNQTIIGPYLTLDTWTHIVLTYSTTYDLQLFINGAFVNRTQSIGYRSLTQSFTIALGTSLQNNQSCNITEMAYNGFIDEFRIYARALNHAAIRTLGTR